MSVDPTRFAEFFDAIYREPDTPDEERFDPFLWQTRLARRVTGLDPRENPWPECIAVPTGCGKTACIDVAVFALACEAAKEPTERAAPRRIIFVVDRRVVVDEAFKHAERIRRRLEEAESKASSGILNDVAKALRHIAGDNAPPLTCHQLRGGMYRDDAWALTPTQPCVICSTVDQYGSRLLFRAYGRSLRAASYLAGLAGNDCLVILDEAHCAVPFSQTMRRVMHYRNPKRWAETAVGGPFHFVLMSATPPKGTSDLFRLDTSPDSPDLRDSERLHARITRPKPAKLAPPVKVKAKRALEDLAVALIEQAATLMSGGRQAVTILVNRVFTAKYVHKLLQAVSDGTNEPSPDMDQGDVADARKAFKGSAPFDTELLTGRMRPIDRDAVVRKWLPQLKSRPDGRPNLERPVIIVATQCLEVGADLDFDGLVTECASLDALRQRFGRLNRTGRDIDARGVIVVRNDQTSEKNPDAVYGPRLAATWNWMKDRATGDEIDFGISAMDALWEGTAPEERGNLVLKGQDAPVMLPAHVDCWAQTSPAPRPTPEVALFLHGPDQGRPEIQICWRADLPGWWDIPAEGTSDPPDALENDVRDAVSLCPPTTLECLSVPLPAFRRWWRDRMAGRHIAQDIADVEAGSAEGDEPEESSRAGTVALVWRGPEESRLLRDPDKELKPGDTVVLPAKVGGWDAFGYVPDERTIDMGDACHFEARRRAVLRLHPPLFTPFAETEDLKRLLDILERPDEPGNEFEWSEVRDRLVAIAEQNADLPAAEGLLKLADESYDLRRPKPHPFGGLVLVGRKCARKNSAQWLAESQSIDDDSASEEARSPLLGHCLEVAALTKGFSSHCDVPKSVAETLLDAARLHDVGKADERFQAWLSGGNSWLAGVGTLLAKSSVSRSRSERERDRRRAGVPGGFRHELVSVRLIESCPELCEAAADRELLLHLVGSHHGYCHPFAPAIDDEGIPVTVEYDGRSLTTMSATGLERLDSGVAERFWRLVRRYGWWGLAYLEAILVLADHRVSEREQETTAQWLQESTT